MSMTLGVYTPDLYQTICKITVKIFVWHFPITLLTTNQHNQQAISLQVLIILIGC